MTGGRIQNDGGDIRTENETLVISTVKKKIKFNIGMIDSNASERFERKPTDSIELVFYQQPGIDSYFQIALYFDQIGNEYF